MIKTVRTIFFSVLLLTSLKSIGQNQVYWREGFEPGSTAANFSPCDLTAVSPTTNSSYYFTGNAGSWYGSNVYRTTGTGCPAGNNHLRYKNISGVTDSGYVVTPLVNFGIQELHFLRARASRSYTIWTTTDITATTTNWTNPILIASSSLTATCVDTTIIIASPTARRLKIVGRPGTDSDIDSIFITSFSQILPVQFGQLSANINSNNVELNWQIETEINTASYYIERSLNGKDFNTAGNVAAKQQKKYSFTDVFTAYNEVFYRIKALDRDGKITLSNIIRLNNRKWNKASLIITNPIENNSFNINANNISKGNYTLNIYSTLGNIVYTTTIFNDGNSLTKSLILPNKLSSGVYRVELKNSTYQLTSSVLVK